MFETTTCTLLPDFFPFNYHPILSITIAFALVESTDYHLSNASSLSPDIPSSWYIFMCINIYYLMPSMIDCMICTSPCACSHSRTCICAQLIILIGVQCWVHRMLSKLHVHLPVRPATGISLWYAPVHMCVHICAFSYICKLYMPEIPAHVPVRVSLWLGACMWGCVCIPAHRWLGVRLRCLQCFSNGDAAVSRRAIDVCTHVCAYSKKQYQATI